MIEANLEGLSWFPTTPGLERDITHIVIKEVDTIPGVIDHILTDTLVFKDLTPYRWLRALGSFRAWIALNDFQNGPLLEFLDFKFSVKDSPGVINFVTDAYQLSEQANGLFVPIRRQYGTDGSASVDIFASKDIEPFDSWSNEGYDDYYTDLTSVAFDPSQNFVVAVGPTSGEILHGNASGWIRKDTNNTPGTNLELTGITHDGSAFWACALDGKIYKSSDGVSWTEKYPAPNGPVELYRIFYLEDAALANEPALFALGENGLILYEDPNDGWIASSTGLSSGLTTAYTSIAPSQIIPNLAGGTIDAISLALTGKLLERTYLSVDAGFGTFSGDRTLGQFSESLPPFAVPNTPGQLSVEEIDQSIDYEEFSFATRFDQLLNTTTSIGASFSWQYAEIDENLRNDLNITSTSPYLDDTNAHLYIGSVYARYQNPNGWFATTDLQYWYQENNSIEPEIDNESAPNLNLSIGYRLQKQKGEVRVSILNLTDEEYELNPLNNYRLPPQERTFVIETRFSF